MAPQTYRRSARFIRDLMLACDPDELEERLAIAAVDLIEQLSATNAVLAATLHQLREQDAEIDRLRARLYSARDEVRDLRPSRKAAA